MSIKQVRLSYEEYLELQKLLRDFEVLAINTQHMVEECKKYVARIKELLQDE